MAVRSTTLTERTTGPEQGVVTWYDTVTDAVTDTYITAADYNAGNFGTPPTRDSVWICAKRGPTFDRGTSATGEFGDVRPHKATAGIWVCLTNEAREDVHRDGQIGVRGGDQITIDRAGGVAYLSPQDYTGTLPNITASDIPGYPGVTITNGTLDVDDDVATRDTVDKRPPSLSAHNSVTVDAETINGGAGGSSYTINHTSAGSDRAVAIGVTTADMNADTTDSVTYDAQSTTERIAGTGTWGGGATAQSRVFSRAAQNTTASASVTANFPEAMSVHAVSAMSVNNADQTTEIDNSRFENSANDTSITLDSDHTGNAGSIIYCVLCVRNSPTVTPGANETEVLQQSVGSMGQSVLRQSGDDGGAITASWTGNNRNMSASVEFREVSAAGGSLPPVPSPRAPIRAQTM